MAKAQGRKSAKAQPVKKEYVSLSPSEREVIAVLWAAERPMKASDVADELERKTGWRLSTTRTFLKRLVAKGAVEIRNLPYERAAVYAPILDETDVRVAEGRSMLQKHFNGALCGLLSCFIERKCVSDDELRQLHEVIAQKLEGKPEAKPAAKCASKGCKKRK
ncbi:MAG: BlaI/MecI/CopY family transcriptional regulator [Thermoguttaceae bacterium]|nr:BlaI/MecI/CopY family transcriptional regulator [Thermoguttaceae bacterium]